MEGFDIGRAGNPAGGGHDPTSAAREAADRIAEQVRDILQNAEQRAGEIRSGAEADAEAIRKDAAEATARMLRRLDELERQLDVYLTGFFNNIRGELSQLADRQDVEAAAASMQDQPEVDRTEEFGPESFESSGPPVALEPDPQNGEPKRRRGLLWGRRAPADEASASIEGSDAEDAHVMALNMALNGTPREETEGYLRQRFAGLGDLDSILDDVYGRVKGR